MQNLTIEKLLEAGVHFGHQTKRWNPNMKRFIFTEKNGIYIIDLKKTMQCIENACQFLKKLVEEGGRVLFVGTKKQAKDTISEEAKRCGMFFVTERWLGGMLTNFTTIRQSVKRLEKIEKMETDGTWEKLPKKEVLGLIKEREKLIKVLHGIRDMQRLPAAVFIIDTKKEYIALKEAQRLNIPVIALIDTNSDPDIIEYPIPANDDALKSIQVITNVITDTIAAAGHIFLEKAKMLEQKAKEDNQNKKDSAAGSARDEDTSDESSTDTLDKSVSDNDPKDENSSPTISPVKTPKNILKEKIPTSI